ncbi:ferredoxin family protein [Rhizobium laguerreae]|jgi:ferredoxin|uniref:ferredoxin n=1 Tax=Rhizobium laguerreae TaxID=1076926 RepID=UPI001C8FD7B5|nr:ferredoxin [Rhizobium laguerreae]MBY3307710.1 ferredoxin family protein [Rhizobium laguerreae]
MAYVITQPCIDVKDGACQVACPVECIYEGGRMMYIQPSECIACGLCLSVCPVDAIFEDRDTPIDRRHFIAANKEFFEDAVTGWGRPGGAGPKYRSEMDHPLVTSFQGGEH